MWPNWVVLILVFLGGKGGIEFIQLSENHSGKLKSEAKFLANSGIGMEKY